MCVVDSRTTRPTRLAGSACGSLRTCSLTKAAVVTPHHQLRSVCHWACKSFPIKTCSLDSVLSKVIYIVSITHSGLSIS